MVENGKGYDSNESTKPDLVHMGRGLRVENGKDNRVSIVIVTEYKSINLVIIIIDEYGQLRSSLPCQIYN